jgi:hypothetical protein
VVGLQRRIAGAAGAGAVCLGTKALFHFAHAGEEAISFRTDHRAGLLRGITINQYLPATSHFVRTITEKKEARRNRASHELLMRG